MSSESIRAVPVSKKITEVEEIFSPERLSEEERKALRMAAYEKNKNRFSRKNITAFVEALLGDRESVQASEIEVRSRRDMIRIIFISLYGQTGKAGYKVRPTGERIVKEGFSFGDFEIRRH